VVPPSVNKVIVFMLTVTHNKKFGLHLAGLNRDRLFSAEKSRKTQVNVSDRKIIKSPMTNCVNQFVIL
jgi:hypothetical protein